MEFTLDKLQTTKQIEEFTEECMKEFSKLKDDTYCYGTTNDGFKTIDDVFVHMSNTEMPLTNLHCFFK